MICSIHRSPTDFLTVCRHAFEANEVVHSLMLGISLRLVKNPQFYGSQPFLATVIDDGTLTLAALMTPPYKLQLARFERHSPESIVLLASELQRHGWRVPGLIGEETAIRTFADCWSTMAGVTVHGGMRQRIYELRKVEPIEYPTGEFRPAALGDLDRAIEWCNGFHDDCFGDTEHPRLPDDVVRTIIEGGDLHFWCDPEPVSMAARTRPTPHGITVGFVYTPPAIRGKGYASAVVARLSQLCLDSGREFCTLYTDLGNPTSNSIYQRIGYRAVTDVMDIKFGNAKTEK